MNIKYSVCPHDCPDTCAWKVEISNGKVTKVDGSSFHPVTKGIICAKAGRYPERVYSPDRVLYPMRRKGKKGNGEFERISWEEALNEITYRWQTLIKRHGTECILPYSYGGTMGIVNRHGAGNRFFNKLGASRLERTICSAAGDAGYSLVYGKNMGINPQESVNAKLIILWGINAVVTNIHQTMLAEQARKQGAKIIVIDVHRNETARFADDFYQVLPGSDAMLALGIAHIIFRDGLHDAAWCGKYVKGIEEFADEVVAYPPQKVAKITGISVARIEELAKLYAQTPESFIRIGNGIQHHDNGGSIVRAIASLPALTGAWQYRGGGAIKSNQDYFPLNWEAVNRPDLLKGNPRMINMNQLGQSLTALTPPIYSLYVYNSNPAIVTPNQNLVIQGLAREDLFTVVHEQLWTDTTKWADIVLPATTSLEHSDLYLSYWHLVIQWAEAVIEPVGESRPNVMVFNEIARRLGFRESCFADTTLEIAGQALDLPYWKDQGITIDRLQKERFIPLKGIPMMPFVKGGFPTKSGKVEIINHDAPKIGLSLVPTHLSLKEGPEVATDEYPLTLITPPNRQYLNSTFANLYSLQVSAKEPLLEIHPNNATERQISQGDLVEVFNQRGCCVLKAKVIDSVLPGVVVSTGVWWKDSYSGDAGVNALTPSRLADMGHGATFFSNLVQVRKKNSQ